MGTGMRLSELLRGSGVEPRAAITVDPVICGTSLDSRRIGPGDLFFAIRGHEADGTTFVPEAVRRGAVAVVAGSPRPADLDEDIGWVQVDEPRRVAGPLSRECYGRPDEALTLVGITGTNGKTTVTHLVESVARAAGRKSGRIGTVGYAFDGKQVPLARTTPEAPDFFRLLSEMRRGSVELVAMEVSSHALALHRVDGARFAVAAFLNLSPDHLDFHGDEQAYFEAKARLFEGLGPDARAVLPADTWFGARLRERTRARVLTFGRSADADVRLVGEHGSLNGSSAILETPAGALPVRTFLLGRANLDNVAAAAACGLSLDLPLDAVASGVLAVEGVPGRMERIDMGQPFAVLVDYAHTSAALAGLLSWLREVTERRVLVVFGCGGERDVGKRPEMGRVAARTADRVFLTSDNPRREDPERILEQIAAGAAEVPGGVGRCVRIENRAEAIDAAIRAARAGDVVAIAGKGHETTQARADGELAFDDREAVRRSLSALGFRGQRRAGA